MSKGERTVTFLPLRNEAPIKTNRASFCKILGFVMILGVVIMLGYYTGLYFKDQRMESSLSAARAEELVFAESSSERNVPPEESNLEFQLPNSYRLNQVRKRRDVMYFYPGGSNELDSSEPVLRVRLVANKKLKAIESQEKIRVAEPFKPSEHNTVVRVPLYY